MILEEVVLLLQYLWDSFWNIIRYPRIVLDDLFSVLWDVIDYYDLDHLYTGTVIANLILVSYWKDIRNWSKLAFRRKAFIASAVLASGSVNLLCLLRLVGLLEY